MSPSRFQRVKDLVLEAWELPPGQRAAFLDARCGDDHELRGEVQAVLAAEEETAGEFVLDQPLADEELAAAAQELDAARPAAGALVPGDRVGEFEVVRFLARGGMGEVYVARQRSPARDVALKVLRRGLYGEEILRRFNREADVLGALHHQGIAQVYASGTVELQGDTLPYIAMEFVAGETLTDHARGKALDQRAVLSLMARVCDAVQHAHDAGIVHRDLKPQNVLVRADGQPKVLDFGIARLTSSEQQVSTLVTEVGQVLGTLPYMSPEQVSGGASVDARADVYALGVMLYELLGGRRPLEFRDIGVPEAMRRIVDEDPRSLGSLDTRLRGDVEVLVGKALDKDVGRRYANAAELAEDIRRHLASEPILAHPPSAMYTLRKFARRHRGLVAGVALAFVALAFGLAVAVRFGMDEARQRETAETSLYRLALEGSSAAWRVGEPVEARAWLEDAPPGRRGWEARHLAARLDPVLWSVPSPLVMDADLLEAGNDLSAWATFDSAGERLAHFVDERTLVIREVSSGRELFRVESPRPLAPHVLAWSGPRILAAETAGRLLVLDGESGKSNLSMDLGGRVRGVSWHSDGRRAAVAVRRDEGTRDALFAGVLAEGLELVELGTTVGPIQSAVWLESLDAVAAIYDPVPRNRYYSVLKVFDASTGAVIHDGRMPGKEPFRWAAAAGRLVATTSNRVTHLWELGSGDLMATPHDLLGHSLQRVAGLGLSEDGRRAVTTTRAMARVWDLDTRTIVNSLPLDGAPVGRLALSPDGSHAALLQGDELRVLPTRDMAARILAGHDTYVYFLALSPDGSLLLSQDYDGWTAVWDTTTWELFARIPPETSRAETPFHVTDYHVAFTDDGQGLRSDDHGIQARFDLALSRTWEPLPDLGTGEVRWSQIAEEGLSSHTQVLSPDGRLLLDTGAARLHRWPDRAIHATLAGRQAVAPTDYQLRVNASGAFSPHGQRVALANGPLTVHAVSDGRRLAELDEHTGRVYAVAWSPDGTRLASGGNDTTVRIWDAETFEPLLVLHGHDQYVHALQWAADGSWLASASGDGTVRIWDSRTVGERHAEGQAEGTRRRAMSIHVRKRLAALADPLLVARELRADTSLDADDRRAALRALRQLLPVADAPSDEER